MTRVRLVLGAAVALGCGAAPANAAVTRYVDDDHAQCPTAGFTQIQPAVDASAAGDSVVVCDGTYRGAVVIGPGKDRLRLTSKVTHGATITSSGPSDAPYLIDVNGADNVLVLKFRLLGGDAQGAACVRRRGILVQGPATGVLIRSNVITGIDQLCDQESAVGIEAGGNTRLSIVGNVISDLHSTQPDDFYPPFSNPLYGTVGIFIYDPGSFPQISDTSITMPGSGVGVYLAAVNASIRGSRITGAHDAIHDDGGGGKISPIGKSLTVRNNTLTGNVNGVAIGNYFNDNSFDPYQSYGPPIPAPTPDAIAANHITSNSGAGILIGGFALITGVKVVSNVVQHNRTGIELVHDLRPLTDGATIIGNIVRSNDARFNSVRDCFEGFYTDGFYPDGTPTADGLFNAWSQNRGTRSVLPAGICR